MSRDYVLFKEVFLSIFGPAFLGITLMDHTLYPAYGERTYLILLQQFLMELLDKAHVPISLRSSMWFQHDGAPCTLYQWRSLTPESNIWMQWIGRGGLIHWPARSPSISCVDFLCWSQMKSWVYEKHIPSIKDFAAHISVASIKLLEMPGIFHSVRNSMRRHCHACRTTSGRNFDLHR